MQSCIVYASIQLCMLVYTSVRNLYICVLFSKLEIITKCVKMDIFFTIFAGDLASDKPFRRAQDIRIIPSTFGEIHVCIYYCMLVYACTSMYKQWHRIRIWYQIKDNFKSFLV